MVKRKQGIQVKKIFTDEKIELILANVKASLEIEGFVVPGEEAEILRQYLKEEFSEEQVLDIIRTTGGKRANEYDKKTSRFAKACKNYETNN